MEQCEGANVVFDDKDYQYTHSRGKGLIHRGDLVHHVTELDGGERENLIIWITVG
jgi:hypothetical protein